MRRVLAVLLLSLAACTSLAFNYRWYGVAPAPGQKLVGTLLGPEPKDDLDLSVCNPDEKDKGKCVVFLRAEFEKLRVEYIDLKERLRACEVGLKF